jgi:hypothetical protein
MVAALGLAVLLAGLVVAQRAGRGAALQLHAVELSGGETLRGALLQLHEGRYLVQTEGKCVVVSAGDIRRVDGKATPPATLPLSSRVPLLQETFEEVLPSGEIELRSTIKAANPGPQVLTRLDWGLAPHETRYLEHYRVMDEFGHELGLQVEDDASIHGKRVRVELERPALPGEEVQLTDVIGGWSRATREGDGWIYRMSGNYPDDRLVTRTVRLPRGAQVVAVSPEPLYSLTSGQQPVVIWRRYFLKGETLPWEIRYRL